MCLLQLSGPVLATALETRLFSMTLAPSTKRGQDVDYLTFRLPSAIVTRSRAAKLLVSMRVQRVQLAQGKLYLNKSLRLFRKREARKLTLESTDGGKRRMEGRPSEAGIAVGEKGIINQGHEKVEIQGHSVTDTKAAAFRPDGIQVIQCPALSSCN